MNAVGPNRASVALSALAADGISSEGTYSSNKRTYSYGAHAAHVAVDPGTGHVALIDYMAVEDVGRIINPLTLHGQTVGAIVQGLGGALLENLAYDENGQFLAGSLADYLLPTASDFPVIRAHALEEKPAPHNPLGAKGAGEGGIIPVGGVIANAVANALGRRAEHAAAVAAAGVGAHPGEAMSAADPEVLIERARSLIPALRQRSAQATAERRLPKETIEDFRRLELTRCLQPAMFGGFASDYRVFSKMLRALAQGCGSSAWVCAVHGEHNWVIGNFSEEAQRDVWGGDPHAVASASVPPSGTAEKISGGHRVSGRWGFASGVDHAQWLLLNAVVKDATPHERLFLIPVGAAEIVDDWHVMGLCGTGSKSVVVKDVTVPATHSVSMHELKTGTGPGAAVHPGHALYRTPRSLLASFSLSSVNVGLAERAVEEFTSFTRERRSRGLRVADLEAIQLTVSEAAAKAEAAALLVEQTIDRNIRSVEARQEITAEQVAWTRRNSSYATRLSRDAVAAIFEAAGGTALYAGNPLQEIFRDAMAASAHLSLAWHRAAPMYGQIRLGLPVDFDAL